MSAVLFLAVICLHIPGTLLLWWLLRAMAREDGSDGGGGGGGGGPPPLACVLMRCPLASAKAVDVTIIHSLRAVLAAMRG